MTGENIERVIAELKRVYGEDVRIAKDANRVLVRVASVDLYENCQPAATPMLFVLDPTQPKPLFYVQPGQLLTNGQPPKNSSSVLVGGETWMQFSFNIPWTESQPIVR